MKLAAARQVSLTRSLAGLFVDLVRREFWKHDDFDAFLADGAHEHQYVRDRARIEKLLKNDQDKL